MRAKSARSREAMAQFRVKVSSNVRAIVEDLRGVTTQEQNRAAARALNRAADRARTAAVRAIRERYRIDLKTANASIAIIRANESRLEVTLKARGRPLTLGRFEPRIAKRGKGSGQLSVNIAHGRKVVPGAFIAKMHDRDGAEYFVVFRRVSKDTARYPIEALKTVDVPGMFSRAEVLRPSRIGRRGSVRERIRSATRLDPYAKGGLERWRAKSALSGTCLRSRT
jgi:hypothetical protein